MGNLEKPEIKSEEAQKLKIRRIKNLNNRKIESVMKRREHIKIASRSYSATKNKKK